VATDNIVPLDEADNRDREGQAVSTRNNNNNTEADLGD